jgi:hypothetical protein
MKSRALLFEHIAPGALFGAGLQKLEIDIAELEHDDPAADRCRLAEIKGLRLVRLGGFPLGRNRLSGQIREPFCRLLHIVGDKAELHDLVFVKQAAVHLKPLGIGVEMN